MLEHADVGVTQPHAKADRGVVELVGDHQTSLADHHRDEGRIRGKTHRTDERILHAHEPRNEGFAQNVEIVRTGMQTRTAGGDAVSFEQLLDGIRAPAARLCKAEIIVRRVLRARVRAPVRVWVQFRVPFMGRGL